MDTDSTEVAVGGEPHPSLSELRNASHPGIGRHLEHCSMCRSVVAADEDLSEPIPLDLPKGLVSENAFRWPADPTARGGMAQIFAGEDRRLGRTVILKAPRDGEELPAGMAEMFQRRVTAEARILAKLQHPSIVTIYELGKSSVGWPFCVLERVDGVSLRDRLDELAGAEAATGRPRTRERLELLSSLVSIAEALAYAHERRVVHRDCTPNNILLGKRGEATLIDWGIARDLDAPGLTTDPALLATEAPAQDRGVTISAGTPPYLPLEQTQGRPADPSFDVYSFGITLYEVVAGRTPFEWRHTQAADARTRQLAAFLDWLRTGSPAMPRDPELSGIIARAMSRSTEARFTADELVRALKQYLTGDLVFSHRYSTTGRLARWARRHRGAAVAVVSVAVFAISGALVWAQLSRRAQKEAQLSAVAAAARADASEKGRAADQAMRDAEAAEALAASAQNESRNADAMRRDAEAKRRAAEAKRHEFEQAALRAKDDADDAFKRYTEAEKDRDEADKARAAAQVATLSALHERDAARSAEQTAGHERDAARTGQQAAEHERDAARAAAAAAESDRDAARALAAAAERDRDAARSSQQAAEHERDAATSARASVERERDEARRKLAELEQQLHERPERPSAPSGPVEHPSSSPSEHAPSAPSPSASSPSAERSSSPTAPSEHPEPLPSEHASSPTSRSPSSSRPAERSSSPTAPAVPTPATSAMYQDR
jgi:tRNA A-37 threonylcarbamoyl transferase component Bud32